MAEKVPRLVATVDVRQFKLDPTDGFLLTRINGRLGKKELAQETGLPEFQVERTLEKLEKLGVVEIVDPNAPPPGTIPPAAPRDRVKLPEFASIGLEPKYDPKELEEDVELSPEQKKRVLDLYYRLEDMDHYTLLGVGQDADKKTVKRAYFELAAAMHPDRYFKKRLGSFKGKMEQLYQYLTSEDFKNVFSSIMEGFKSLQDSHASEKLKVLRLWKEREKVLERILASSINFYGSVRGIAGQAVPQIKMLEESTSE